MYFPAPKAGNIIANATSIIPIQKSLHSNVFLESLVALEIKFSVLEVPQK